MYIYIDILMQKPGVYIFRFFFSYTVFRAIVHSSARLLKLIIITNNFLENGLTLVRGCAVAGGHANYGTYIGWGTSDLGLISI